jgi:DNA replication protein DnaT
MSWPALKWAATQRAGSLTNNAILRVLADHADKNGQVWVSAPEIARELDTSKPTVLKAQKALLKRGLICDTRERRGATGHVPVFQLQMVKEETSNGEETVKERTSNGKGVLPFHDTRARVIHNPITDNPKPYIDNQASHGSLTREQADADISNFWARNHHHTFGRNGWSSKTGVGQKAEAQLKRASRHG